MQHEIKEMNGIDGNIPKCLSNEDLWAEIDIIEKNAIETDIRHHSALRRTITYSIWHIMATRWWMFLSQGVNKQLNCHSERPHDRRKKQRNPHKLFQMENKSLFVPWIYRRWYYSDFLEN